MPRAFTTSRLLVSEHRARIVQNNLRILCGPLFDGVCERLAGVENEISAVVPAAIGGECRSLDEPVENAFADVPIRPFAFTIDDRAVKETRFSEFSSKQQMFSGFRGRGDKCTRLSFRTLADAILD